MPGVPREGAVVYREKGEFFLKPQLLSGARLIVAGASAIDEEGETYLCVSSIAGVEAELNEARQELYLRAGPKAFAVTRDKRGRSLNAISQPLEPASSGFFVNYDSNVQAASKSVRVFALAEVNVFGAWGSLVSTIQRGSLANARGVTRMLTTYIFDLPHRRETIRIGDSLTPGSTWGRSLYFGGIQWGTAFETQPDFVRFPLPSIRGEAVVPSTAELYVNQSLRWTSEVPAGPFEIVRPPLMSGPGQYQLVVRDALGRQTVQEQNYYASPRLLGRGVSDYAVSVGLTRNALGLRSNAYGRAMGTAQYARGVFHRVTLDARAEAASGLAAVGAGFAALVHGPVIVSGTWAESTAEGGLRGRVLGGSVSMQTNRLSLGGQTLRATGEFRQLGLDREQLPYRRTDNAYLTLSIWRRDNLAVSYVNQNRGASAESFANASYSANLRGSMSLIALYSRSLSGARRSSLSVGLNFRVGERDYASLSGTHGAEGTGARGSLQRNLPMGEGFGYRMAGQTGFDSRLNASAIKRMPRMEVEGGFETSRAGFGGQGGVRGSFGMLGKGKWFVSRTIDDGFAILNLNGFAGVDVMSDNQRIARTNGSGIALIPRLLSFQPNRLSIDPENLPMDAEIEKLSVTVRPGRRRGVLVNFPVKRTRGFTLRLVDAAGNPLPAGAAVSAVPGEDPLATGYGGLLYVRVTAEKSLSLAVQWPGRTCKVEWRVPVLKSAQTDPETVACK